MDLESGFIACRNCCVARVIPQYFNFENTTACIYDIVTGLSFISRSPALWEFRINRFQYCSSACNFGLFCFPEIEHSHDYVTIRAK